MSIAATEIIIDNSIKLKGFGGNWEKVMEAWDTMPMGEYVEFCIAWLNELKRIVKPSGSIWIHGTYHNIGIINFCMQLLEIEIINEILPIVKHFPPLLQERGQGVRWMPHTLIPLSSQPSPNK